MQREILLLHNIFKNVQHCLESLVKVINLELLRANDASQ